MVKGYPAEEEIKRFKEQGHPYYVDSCGDCHNEKNWAYDDLGYVYCKVCGAVVFDGPEADEWGYNH